MIKFDFPRLLEFTGDSLFNRCDNIKELNIKETKIQRIGQIYFQNLTKISFPSTVLHYDIINISENEILHIEVVEWHLVVQSDPCGYFFSNRTIFQSNKKSSRVIIRHGVERIARICFSESNLVSVTIPSSVTEISDFAFSWCKSLESFHKKSLKLPKSLKNICSNTFDFSSLELDFIGKWAFF